MKHSRRSMILNTMIGAALNVVPIWIFSSQAFAVEDCSMFEPWLTEGHAPIPANPTYQQRVDQTQKEYSLRVQTAAQLNKLYESGKLDGAALDFCLGTLGDRENFLDTFYYTLFSDSVEKLDASKSPAVQALMKMFHTKFGSGVPIFRVTGSFGEQDPTMLPAGVQRGTDSMYMDFSKIDPNDWLMIFVHETLHAVDDQIFIGVQGYSNETLVQHFVELSKTTKASQALDAAEQASLDQWLMFGLDRGLLAEYRAWSATFLIYREGLSEGLWNHRPWLDQIVNNQKRSESLPYFTYQYLDPRSADPTDDIFSNPLVDSGLKTLRQQLRRSRTPPPLDDLAPILASGD